MHQELRGKVIELGRQRPQEADRPPSVEPIRREQSEPYKPIYEECKRILDEPWDAVVKCVHCGRLFVR